MIAAVDTDSPREVFFRVAAEMFSDGNFNWGRVVALFYFASKLVLKVGGCRALSPGRLPSGLRGPGSHEVNPRDSPETTEGMERVSYGPLISFFIHVFMHSAWASLVAQMIKNPPANAGDRGLIPGSERSPGKGNGNPLQYSCLVNSRDRRAWPAIVCGVAKSRTQLSDPHTHTHTHTHIQQTFIGLMMCATCTWHPGCRTELG